MKKCLILGSYGLLGCELAPYLEGQGYFVFRHGRRAEAQCRLNFEDTNEIVEFYEKNKIDVIINLVAETGVDKCEVDIQGAFSSNAFFVERVIKSIKACVNSKPPHLIQISSDHVYSGAGPHLESSCNPVNIYAITKLGGELIAGQVKSTILRTNFIGRSTSPGRVGLSDWIVHTLQKEQRITVFDNVLFSPLHTTTLCKMIELVVLQQKEGTYNLSSSVGNSKAYLATSLAQKLHLDMDLISVGNYKKVSQLAMRPLDMRLNSKKFEKDFEFVLPTFDEQIELTAKEY